MRIREGTRRKTEAEKFTSVIESRLDGDRAFTE